MPVQLMSADGMLPNVPYHHVAVATGARSVYVAGQVAGTNDGSPMPTTLSGQVAQALRNVERGLAAAGASFSDVVRLTIYVTDWDVAMMDELMAGIRSVAEEVGLPFPLPPASLIGVAVLFDRGTLVEIEATAVLD